MVDMTSFKQLLAVLAAGAIGTLGAGAVRASDHLDTPTVAMNPRADIGDLYAWTSPDGKQLNLVMTVVAQSFSDKVEYTFHIDSGKRIGATTGTTTIVCRFNAAQSADCRADSAAPLKVFAGKRDDPFFNNVRGTRAAYQRAAAAAVRNGAATDAAGCPTFDASTTEAILADWRHTDGGAAKDFLEGWTPASLVVSIDIDRVAKQGPLLGVWATTSSQDGQLDRVGRPLTGNALLGTLATADVSDKLKEDYNRATPSTAARFVPEIEKNLGLYDAFDGKCGNQLLASKLRTGAGRYRDLATLLADDRLWVNSASGVCKQFFAVELASLMGETELDNDCGGRSPRYSAANEYRSFLTNGTPVGIDDGLTRDKREQSSTTFPFLAAPEAAE
ncbi:MAG TPA: DUF4331 family protein [Steroidobacteraceae bacterium]|nr:DUF4331 family protein [Steroidobacteraceae bacterium]